MQSYDAFIHVITKFSIHLYAHYSAHLEVKFLQALYFLLFLISFFDWLESNDKKCSFRMISRYQKSIQKLQYEEEQTRQWPIEKGEKTSNGRLNTERKPKDWANRTILKTETN